MCADIAFGLRARIEGWSTRPEEKKGEENRRYLLHHIIIEGNISKIFWPLCRKKILWLICRNKNEELIQLRKARGKALREALNIKNDSPLRSRNLRNIFEHFDERMDEWFRKTERRGFSDRNVGSFEEVTLPRPSDRLRTFVPETWTIIYCGREFKLSSAIRAVCGLYDEIQLKICQPGKHRKLLSEDILQELIELGNAPHRDRR